MKNRSLFMHGLILVLVTISSLAADQKPSHELRPSKHVISTTQLPKDAEVFNVEMKKMMADMASTMRAIFAATSNEELKTLKGIQYRKDGELTRQNNLIQSIIVRAGFKIVAKRDWPSDFEFHAVAEKNGKYFFVEADQGGLVIWPVKKEDANFDDGHTPPSLELPVRDSNNNSTNTLITDGWKTDKYHFQLDIIKK